MKQSDIDQAAKEVDRLVGEIGVTMERMAALMKRYDALREGTDGKGEQENHDV